LPGGYVDDDDQAAAKSLEIADRVAEHRRQLEELAEKSRRLRERAKQLRDETKPPPPKL
jgi:uncharacterized coiled-coil protein SlyX